jgi:hypothetical protein
VPAVAWQVSSADALTLLSSKAPSALIFAGVKLQDMLLQHISCAWQVHLQQLCATTLYAFSVASMTMGNVAEAIICEKAAYLCFAPLSVHTAEKGDVSNFQLSKFVAMGECLWCASDSISVVPCPTDLSQLSCGKGAIVCQPLRSRAWSTSQSTSTAVKEYKDDREAR